MNILPISVVIPTFNRPGPLSRTLDSLARQQALPAQIIIVDGSDVEIAPHVAQLCRRILSDGTVIELLRAVTVGAAAQRNQGVAFSSQPFILFLDDDILFEPDCISRLWLAIGDDSTLGAVNAIITNQSYREPGIASRIVFTLLHGRRERSFAGRVIGPGVNVLPEDRADLPTIVPVEWLNTTCALYRMEAMPDPPFDSVFTGYSLMEDLTLSLRVGKRWKLANVRTARIFHDSQPGSHKSDPAAIAEMELLNRLHVMTHVMGRIRGADYARLMLWEIWQLLCGVRSGDGLHGIVAWLSGKRRALRKALKKDMSS